MLIKEKYTQSIDLIGLTIFFALSSLLIRGSFYASFFNGILIGLLILELFKTGRWKTLKSIPQSIILGLPALLTIVGLYNSIDLSKSLALVFRTLPILLLPFLILNTSRISVKKGFTVLEYYFPLLTLIIMYCYVITAYSFELLGMGDYLYYSHFSEILDIHTTYIGALINIAILFLINNIHNKNRALIVFYYLLFFILQIFIASKISLLVCSFLGLYIFVNIKLPILVKILAVLLPVVILFNSKDLIEDRLSGIKLDSTSEVNYSYLLQSFLSNDINYRYLLWKSHIESLEPREVLLGKGSYPDHTDKIEKYKQYNLEVAELRNFNAHNQFIETYYRYGLLGLFLFLTHCLFLFYYCIKSKDRYLLVVLISILIYFMFESFLIRSFGIVLYGFILVYLLVKFNSIEKEPSL
jgi:O-antigen ligase